MTIEGIIVAAAPHLNITKNTKAIRTKSGTNAHDQGPGRIQNISIDTNIITSTMARIIINIPQSHMKIVDKMSIERIVTSGGEHLPKKRGKE